MYKPFSSFVFRSPLLSFDRFQMTLKDKDSLLKEMHPHILEAIYIASPVLYKELKKVIEGGVENKDARERVLLSTERYIGRMSTRCTPFGLFAGCGIGKIGADTNISANDSYGRVTRLDMSYLSALYDAVVKIPMVKEHIKYFPNNSLYRIGRKYRYVESLSAKTTKKYQISEVAYSEYLSELLKSAESGRRISELVAILMNKGFPEEDATDFINELITSQLIVAELNQSVTGDDLFTRIIHLLEAIDCDEWPLLSQLKKIKELLEQMDSGIEPLESYGQIIGIIDELKVPYEENHLFQVDLIKDTKEASLSLDIVEEIRSAIGLLNKIASPVNNGMLDQFRQDFYKRYEERQIPLMEALDPEIGLGYPTGNNASVPAPLVDNFTLPRSYAKTANFQSNLFRKMLCVNQNCKEIELSEKDLKGFNTSWSNLPPTIYSIFNVVRANPDDFLIKIKSCGGSCGANLIGRFAHTRQEITEFVKEITDKEQELMPDVILAEIVHTPAARVGNILFRPHIRNYELLYMSDSDMPKEQIIHLSDLMVSVRRNRIILHSKRLNKEIVPRLTTAHNYHNGTMPVYRFLCDLQSQHQRNALYFNWGHPFEQQFSFLPRVRYKRTILSSAIWLVEIDEIRRFFQIEKDELLTDSIKKWRDDRFMPQYVLLPDRDNELFVDWESALSVRSLFSMIKNRQQLRFTEFLFEPEHAMIKSKNGIFTNECIVAFYQDKEVKK